MRNKEDVSIHVILEVINFSRLKKVIYKRTSIEWVNFLSKSLDSWNKEYIVAALDIKSVKGCISYNKRSA